MRFIRFDAKKRAEPDKFTLIFKVWNVFTENSQNFYKTGVNPAVDEQLFARK